MRQFVIKGRLVRFYTVAELAKMCKRQPDTIRKMHFSGFLPEPIARTDETIVKRTRRPGFRLYSEDLAKELAGILTGLRQGQTPTSDMKEKIAEAFKRERELLT